MTPPLNVEPLDDVPTDRELLALERRAAYAKKWQPRSAFVAVLFDDITLLLAEVRRLRAEVAKPATSPLPERVSNSEENQEVAQPEKKGKVTRG